MNLRSSLLALLLIPTAALADEATVTKLFRERFPALKLDSVAKAPMPGMYEVFAGGRIVYVDEAVDNIVQGVVFDVKTRHNLTQERLDKLTAVNFDELPLDLAVKIVKGSGARRLAVFEDPDCPYCRKLEGEFAKLDNVTIYVFLYPIAQLHPGAVEKSRRIWCAPDRAQAWQTAMSGGTSDAAATCETPLDKIGELARKYGVTGTPTLFFPDGKRAPGAIAAAAIEPHLGSAEAPKAESASSAK